MPDIESATREAVGVRRATASELPQLAAVLARAFYDDPQVRWLLPDDDRRLAISERGFGLFLSNLWFVQDECYTTLASPASRSGSCPVTGR